MVGPLAMLGGGVLAMTLSACYGAADDYYPPEDTGTADTAADAAPDMGVDTGTADTGSGDTGSGDTGSGDAASDAAGDAASDAAGDV